MSAESHNFILFSLQLILIYILQMGADNSKVQVLSARKEQSIADEDEKVHLNLMDLGLADHTSDLAPEMQRFDLSLKQLSQIQKMHEDLLNNSNEEMESHRIQQVQIETFLNVFSQDKDNFMEVNPEGYLAIKNMNNQQNIVFKNLQIRKLPGDQKQAFTQVIEKQKQGLPEEFGGTLKSTIRSKNQTIQAHPGETNEETIRTLRGSQNDYYGVMGDTGQTRNFQVGSSIQLDDLNERSVTIDLKGSIPIQETINEANSNDEVTPKQPNLEVIKSGGFKMVSQDGRGTIHSGAPTMMVNIDPQVKDFENQSSGSKQSSNTTHILLSQSINSQRLKEKRPSQLNTSEFLSQPTKALNLEVIKSPPISPDDMLDRQNSSPYANNSSTDNIQRQSEKQADTPQTSQFVSKKSFKVSQGDIETPDFQYNIGRGFEGFYSSPKKRSDPRNVETPILKKLTEQFRQALVQHKDKQDYDKEASQKFKSLMCQLIANKHKKIMENPKEEKKDGLQEFLDQKKKLNSSAFRSTKNLDINILSVDLNLAKTKQDQRKTRFRSRDQQHSMSNDQLLQRSNSIVEKHTPIPLDEKEKTPEVLIEEEDPVVDEEEFPSSKFSSSEPETSSYDRSRSRGAKIDVGMLSPIKELSPIMSIRISNQILTEGEELGPKESLRQSIDPILEESDTQRKSSSQSLKNLKFEKKFKTPIKVSGRSTSLVFTDEEPNAVSKKLLIKRNSVQIVKSSTSLIKKNKKQSKKQREKEFIKSINLMVKVIDSVLDPVIQQKPDTIEKEPNNENNELPAIVNNTPLTFNNNLKIPSFVNKAMKINHKKLLSFNTILEENKEYEQSSVCYSANQMSQFQSEISRVNLNSKIGTSFYSNKLQRKNTLGGKAQKLPKDSVIEQSFYRKQFGRQKTLNYSESKSGSQMQHRSAHFNSYAQECQKSYSLDSVRSEGSQGSSVKKRIIRIGDSVTSYKNQKKHQESMSPLLPNFRNSMEISHNFGEIDSISINSKFSKQSASMKISQDKQQQQSQYSGLNTGGSNNLLRNFQEFPEQPVICKDASNVLSWSQTESENNIKIGLGNLDSQTSTPMQSTPKEPSRKQKVNKLVQFSKNKKQYIYSHDYTKGNVQGQNLIKNIKRIQQKLNIKDNTVIPIIFDEVKKNQLIKKIIDSKNIKPVHQDHSFMEKMLDSYHRNNAPKILSSSEYNQKTSSDNKSPQQSNVSQKRQKFRMEGVRTHQFERQTQKIIGSKDLKLQKQKTDMQNMMTYTDDELFIKQPTIKMDDSMESATSYDLEEESDQEFTEYHMCDADDSRRNSMITDGGVVLREASSISNDNAQSSIEAQLKLGSSISLTPSKSRRLKGKMLKKLDTNIDFDNITAKSNSFTYKNTNTGEIALRFQINKIQSNDEEKKTKAKKQTENLNHLKLRKKDLDSMTPKSAQIQKNEENLQPSMKVSTNLKKDRNAISLSISKNNSVLMGETPFSKTMSFQQGKDSHGSESQEDFTKYLQRNKKQDSQLNVKKINYQCKNSQSFSPVTASHILNRVQNEDTKKLIEDMNASNGFKTPGNHPNMEFNSLSKKMKEPETQKSSSTDFHRFRTEDFRFPKNSYTQYQQNIPKQDLLSPYSHQKKQRNKKISDDDVELNSNSGNSDFSGKSHVLLTQYTISTSSCVSQSRGKKWQINQYEVLQDIGKGKYSIVKKIRDKTTKQCFAMKIISKYCLQKKKLAPQKSQFTQVEKEVAIMKKMGHPYIVKLIEIIDDPSHHKQFLIQEYVPNGDLMKKIQSGDITEAQIRKYFKQLISAVWYCHEILNIFHRDIKPDNILLDNDDNIKLTDFGVSDFGKSKKHKHCDEKLYGNAGSHCYFCPEACQEKGYSGKHADLWACAITLYQMVYSGDLPFISKSNNVKELYNSILTQQPKMETPRIKITNLSSLLDLLNRMLNKDPKKRISVLEMQDHPWITNNGKEPCNWATDVEYVDFQKVTDEECLKAMTTLKQYVNMKFRRERK